MPTIIHDGGNSVNIIFRRKTGLISEQNVLGLPGSGLHERKSKKYKTMFRQAKIASAATVDAGGHPQLNRVCRKIRDKHHFEYDLNSILSDLIYTRILDPGSKRSSYASAKNFLEAPEYKRK